MDTGQSKHRLLLVDGDPKSLRVLEVSLKKAGFEVVTANQSSEALGALAAALPDLIISDTDLDGMDGFDLCRQIKAKPEWAKIPFLFVSSRKSIEDKIRGLELGVDDYLTKPIYIKEIGIRVRTALQRAERERLESRREGRTKFAGDLADIGVVDLVQTIDLNRKSGIIHIVNRDGRRGAVFFREGRVIDAEVGRLSGAEAMYRLFSWSDGRFEVEFKPIRRGDVVDLPSAALLMEGMRRLDEWTLLLEKLPALNSAVEVDFRVLAEQLADLPDEMNGILRLCDGNRTLLAVIDDSDYPDLEALTVVSKLLDQGIIYAREPPGLRSEAEPGGELARWLAEGNAEEGAVAEEVSATQRFVAEAKTGGSTDSAAGERQATTDDVKSSGERQGGKTLKAFLLHGTTLSLDTPPPAREGQGASLEPDKRAPSPKLSGNTLRLTAPLPDQDFAAVHPAAASPASPTGELAPAEAASALEGSAVVEDSWREPAELALGPSRKVGVGDALAPAVRTPADRAAAMAKPDTLRGIPIPESIADPDEAGPVRPSVAVDAERPARTTIEFISSQGAVAPVASAGPAAASSADEPADEVARETDWGGWAQGTESKPAAESVPLQAAAPGAEVGAQAAPSLAGPEPEPPGSAPPPGHGDARASDQAPQAQQSARERGMAETTFVLSRGERTLILTEDQRAQARLGLDQLDSDILPHERRWPLYGVALVLLVAAGLLALRTSSTGSRSAESSPPGSLPATAPAASVGSAIEADQGADRGSAQSVDQVPGAPLTAAAVTAQKPAAATAEGQAKPPRATGQERGSQPRTASGPNHAADGGQTRPTALGAVTPGAEGLGDRCRKADAGGKGKPTVVLAACRPAIEAEPDAADIMVILARVELERGRAAEARSWAKKALAIDPDLADGYVFLGGAEQEMENQDAAKAAYKKYLELAPTGRHARELRAVLDSL
jgi:CheY-like chemotaxis protein